MKLIDFEIKIKLIPKGKIIAYKTEEYLTIEEFNLLSEKIKDKFKPVYENYKVKYLKG